MSTPGIRPRTDKQAASFDKKGPPRKLRVLSTETAAAAPSIAMPRAKTELTELFAGDSLLCVRRRAAPSAPRTNADSPSDTPVIVDPASPEASADADLCQVVTAWPGLPRNVRAAILAMIRETV